MQKKKKGMSFEEKRDKIVDIFQSTLGVYNYKEIEKFSVKAGIRWLKSLSSSKGGAGLIGGW